MNCFNCSQFIPSLIALSIDKFKATDELISIAVSNIDYDLELQFLKSEEELEQERRAKEAKAEQERRAKEAKNSPPPQTPPTQTPPPVNNKAPPPMIDRSRKPNNLNNETNNKNDKNVYDGKTETRSKVRIETIHNNLNKPQLTTNLDELRRDLEQEKSKDNEQSALEKTVNRPQPIPNRALKPKGNNNQESVQPKVENKDQVVEEPESSAKLQSLESHIAEKQREALLKHQENQRLAMEHQVNKQKKQTSTIDLKIVHCYHCWHCSQI